jgi:broad specificity phosphatase PhoE
MAFAQQYQPIAERHSIPVNTLYLVRHGENPANIDKQFSYRLVDYSLTPKGVLQAQQTAEFLRDKRIHAIYTSPLKRALETALIIGGTLGRAVTILEDFREINVGTLEGQPPTIENWRLHNQVLRDWFNGRPESSFPEGENYPMVLERVRRGLTAVLRGRENQNLVVVAHGGIFTALLHDVCPDCDHRTMRRQEFGNCGIAVVEIDDHERLVGRISVWGSCDHLSGEAAELVSGTMRA